MLREWATATFQSATDYWTFRKVITLQLALAGFAEYVLHLSRLNPDILYIHQVALFTMIIFVILLIIMIITIVDVTIHPRTPAS